jgi:hypothetical protein
LADNLNLTPDRGPNVWNKREAQPGSWKSDVGAVVMLAAGAAAAFVGGRRLYRAVRDARTEGMLDRMTDEADDLVTRESQQSFPASDSPSWTPTEGANAEKARRWR